MLSTPVIRRTNGFASPGALHAAIGLAKSNRAVARDRMIGLPEPDRPLGRSRVTTTRATRSGFA